MPLNNPHLIKKYSALSTSTTDLDLSQCALFDEEIDELEQLFRNLPATIKTLDLSWNFAAHKDCETLALILKALPPTLESLDLSGWSLHLRPQQEVIRLLSVLEPEVKVIVEHKPFIGLVQSITLIRMLQKDVQQQSAFPIAIKTRSFLAELSEAQQDDIWTLMGTIEQFAALTPWAYLASIYLASPKCNILAPEVVTDASLCSQLIDWAEHAMNNQETKGLVQTWLYMIQASTPHAALIERIKTLSPSAASEFIPSINSFAPEPAARQAAQAHDSDQAIPAQVALATSAFKWLNINRQHQCEETPEQRLTRFLTKEFSQKMQEFDELISLHNRLSEQKAVPVYAGFALKKLLGTSSPSFSLMQKVHLVTELAQKLDSLPEHEVFYPSLDSILISNKTIIGTINPLKFVLSPWALKQTAQLPSTTTRQSVHQTMLAIVCLQLTAQCVMVNDANFWPQLHKQYQKAPALMLIFTELWEAGKAASAIPQSIQASSPTLDALISLASKEQKEYKPEHVPGLMLALTRHDELEIHRNAINQLYNLCCQTSNKTSLDTIYNSITEHIELLVPHTSGPTALADSTNADRSIIWLQRMQVITKVLEHLLSASTLERLHQAQTQLFRAGFIKQLGGGLINAHKKFTLKILIPIVTATIMMSIHNPSLQKQFIFANNVRRMAKMLLDGCNKQLIGMQETGRYVARMLLLSDFTTWLQPENPQFGDDQSLQELWQHLERDVFLLKVLPVAPKTLSVATIQALVFKLQQIIVTELKEQRFNQPTQHKVLYYTLAYLNSFAWNSTQQAKTISYRNRYTANFMSVITTQAQTILFCQTEKKAEQELLTQQLTNHLIAEQENYYSSAQVSRMTTRFWPTPYHLTRVIPEHIKANTRYYAINGNKAGAPQDCAAVYLNIPPDSDIFYKTNTATNSIDRNVICTPTSTQLPTYQPLTLSSSQRICAVTEQNNVNGTQGMYEINIIDIGERPQLQLGLTWAKDHDYLLSLPSSTAYYVALECATGCIHYLDEQGRQVRYPYTSPIHSGNKVWIAISGQQLYFVVNNEFYPPVPGVLLPLGADVYPLVHLGSNGIKLRTQVMTSQWRLERDDNDRLVDRDSNPLAYQLYLAEAHNKVCPHYFAQTNYPLDVTLLEQLFEQPQQLVALPPLSLYLMLMIKLARQTCMQEDCLAPKLIESVINMIIKRAKEPSLPEIDPLLLIDMATALELPQLVTLLQEQHKAATANNAMNPQRFFAKANPNSIKEEAESAPGPSSSN